MPETCPSFARSKRRSFLNARVVPFLATAALSLSGAPSALEGQTPTQAFNPALFQAMEYRMVGPFRGGRVTAVMGYRDRIHTFLMGTVGGGVWRTDDAGESWHNITDGYLERSPIGAIAVAPSDPNVIYVGTGSGGVRGNVSVGNGVYRSTDDGDTWTWIGLPESEHINRIQVHQQNPDVAFVAALGHIFGPNEERGVYRTRDGGATWEKVLYISPRTGAIDLVMHPTNPRILYAAMWRAERKPWGMTSGGDEGGVYKTIDGGDTWERLDGGLPAYPIGRIGLALSPADPDRIWALVEAEVDRGLYRSDDAGRSWQLVSDDRNMMARPWYYMHVDAHPTDPNTVFVSNEGFYRSIDGGRTMEAVPTPHGDNHDLWINPDHPEIWIQSNDGGANVTLTDGRTWSTQLNQPTAEFYTVEVDDAFPYRLYAPQQDNTTISFLSRSLRELTPYESWFEVAGCETGPIALDPEDPNIVYGACQGQISVLDRRTGQERAIWEYPQEYHGRANSELVYRHQWNSQIRVSPHDPDVVYHTSQFVHRTRDGGQTWQTISPDLTRWEEHAELHTGPPGGPITHDQTGVEIYGTIYALQESPHEAGVIWAGSDDGAIHLTRDGGATWSDVTPPGLPLHSTVNRLALSPHDPAKAYAVIHRYRMDDWRPYIYRTDDYGASWTLLTDGSNGIPADYWTRTVVEDPDREGLLYAGTEFGMFISFDDGARWQSFDLNLPETPITDLKIHEQDLVVATQGRGLWILDDLTPLHQLDAAVAAADAHLFTPRGAYRIHSAFGLGVHADRRGQNPPNGAVINYVLAGTPDAEATLDITDAAGTVIRRYSSTAQGRDRLGTDPGMNRVVWDLRYPPAYIAPGVNEVRSGTRVRVAVITGFTGGPLAVPGTYQATLTVGGQSQTRSFQVLKDPRVSTTVAELQENFELSVRVRDRISAIQTRIAGFNDVLGELDTVEELVDDDEIRTLARQVGTDLTAVGSELYKHRLEGDHANLHPKLTTEYARVYDMLNASDHRPPASAYRRLDDLDPLYADLSGRMDAIYATDLARLNEMLRERGFETIIVPRGDRIPVS